MRKMTKDPLYSESFDVLVFATEIAWREAQPTKKLEDYGTFPEAIEEAEMWLEDYQVVVVSHNTNNQFTPFEYFFVLHKFLCPTFAVQYI